MFLRQKCLEFGRWRTNNSSQFQRSLQPHQRYVSGMPCSRCLKMPNIIYVPTHLPKAGKTPLLAFDTLRFFSCRFNSSHNQSLSFWMRCALYVVLCAVDTCPTPVRKPFLCNVHSRAQVLMRCYLWAGRTSNRECRGRPFSKKIIVIAIGSAAVSLEARLRAKWMEIKTKSDSVHWRE